MKRIMLRVAYDGTDFHGWQRQPDKNTVEDYLNEALSKLLHEQIQVIGASRTDAGVHAYGNVAVFDTETRIPPEKLAYAVNPGLPQQIRVLSSMQVPGDFHPRHTDSVKTYEYQIIEREIPFPMERLYAHTIYGTLDVEKMKKAGAYLVGEHDFTSFCSVDTQVEDKVRTIYALEVDTQTLEGGRKVTIRVRGNGFLYNMVRIIAGTLIQVGLGRIEIQEVEKMLEAKDRQAAGPTAPAKGLCLVRLEYPLLTTTKSWDRR